MGELAYFVDEDVLPLGKALRAVRSDVTHPGAPDCPISLGAADETWLPYVGGEGLVVITRNKRIRTQPVQRDLLAKYVARVVFLTQSGNRSRWELLQLVVRHWNAIEEVRTYTGPWLGYLASNGLKPASGEAS